MSLALVGTIAAGIARTDNVWSIALIAIAVVTALQIGYLIGIWLLHCCRKVRSPIPPLGPDLGERLPPDLADMAIGEFANLLDSGFQREALAIFTGHGWRIGDRLLLRLKDVAEIHREGFARILYFDGYDIDVPGIKRPVPRRWR